MMQKCTFSKEMFFEMHSKKGKKIEGGNESELDKIVFTELNNIFFQIQFIIFQCRITSFSLVTVGAQHPVEKIQR